MGEQMSSQKSLLEQIDLVSQMQRYITNMRTSFHSVVRQLLVSRGHTPSDAEVVETARRIVPPLLDVINTPAVPGVPEASEVPEAVNAHAAGLTRLERIRRLKSIPIYSEQKIAKFVQIALQHVTRDICRRLFSQKANTAECLEKDPVSSKLCYKK